MYFETAADVLILYTNVLACQLRKIIQTSSCKAYEEILLLKTENRMLNMCDRHTMSGETDFSNKF